MRLGLGIVLELGRLDRVRLGLEVAQQHDHAHQREDAPVKIEGEGVATDDGGADTADGRTDDEAGDLEGAVEAEGLAALVGIGGVDDHAARGRVVGRRRQAGQEAQDHEGREGREEDRQHAARPRASAAPPPSAACRSWRSAHQPKIGSKMSLATAQAATMTPSPEGSMPCSSMYSGSTGSRAPNPMVTIICTAKMGSNGCQRRSHAEIRSLRPGRGTDIAPETTPLARSGRWDPTVEPEADHHRDGDAHDEEDEGQAHVDLEERAGHDRGHDEAQRAGGAEEALCRR